MKERVLVEGMQNNFALSFYVPQVNVICDREYEMTNFGCIRSNIRYFRFLRLSIDLVEQVENGLVCHEE